MANNRQAVVIGVPKAPKAVAKQTAEGRNPSMPATVVLTGNKITITATITQWFPTKAKPGKEPTGSQYVTLALNEVLVPDGEGGTWRMSGTANVFLRVMRSEDE